MRGPRRRWVGLLGGLLIVLSISGSLTLVTEDLSALNDGVPNLNPEIEEGWGDGAQVNCVQEAYWQEPTSLCPSVPTDFDYPSFGIRILDSTFTMHGPNLRRDFYSVKCDLDCSTVSYNPYDAFNTARSTGGLLPDIILPGLGKFYAFYGIWDDIDQDGWIDWVWRKPTSPLSEDYFPDPRNEFISIYGARIVTFLEPGSFPAIDDFKRPRGWEPDVRYGSVEGCAVNLVVRASCNGNFRGYSQTDGSTLFLTGSLFSEKIATTIQGWPPYSAPDTPYLAEPGGLVDVDRYVEIAPSILSPIWWNTLGQTLDEGVGSPSFGLCPTYKCKLYPLHPEDAPWVGGTLSDWGAESLTGPPQSRIFAPYLPEYLPGSNSTGEGLQDALYATYVPWIDLILEYSPGSGGVDTLVLDMIHYGLRNSARMPLPRNPDGRPFLPPGGDLVATVWIGAWRDINGDGFVGQARTPDPYENGTRPMADNYLQSGGEFIPGEVSKIVYYERCFGFTTSLGWINITVYPDQGDLSALNPTVSFYDADACIMDRAYHDEYDNEGEYNTAGSLLGPHAFSLGSIPTGFWVCAGPAPIVVRGVPVVGDLKTDPLFDCDHVEQPDPAALAEWLSSVGRTSSL